MKPLAPVAAAGRADLTLAHNMKLISQHELQGFGGMGEGIAMQLTDDGRRVMWLAHESAPKNFTAVDVTDPRAPKVLVQTELPHMKVRSNSLDVCGRPDGRGLPGAPPPGMKPAGFDLFDISVPEKPRLISHFDCSGPFSRGVHALWFVDGKTVHMAAGRPTSSRTTRWTTSSTASSTWRPHQAGRDRPLVVCRARAWATAQRRRRACRQFDTGFRAHNTNVFPERPTAPTWATSMAAPWCWTSPTSRTSRWCRTGTTRRPSTASPTPCCRCSDRGLWIVSDECVQDDGADWPKLVWVVDARSEAQPVAHRHLPDAAGRGLHEAGRALRCPQPAREPAAARPRSAVGHHHHRHLLQRWRARVRHHATPTAWKRSPTSCRARPSSHRPAPSSSTTSTSTRTASSTPSIASPAGSTCWS